MHTYIHFWGKIYSQNSVVLLLGMFITLEICLKNGILDTYLVGADRFWVGMLFLELARQQFTSKPC